MIEVGEGDDEGCSFAHELVGGRLDAAPVEQAGQGVGAGLHLVAGHDPQQADVLPGALGDEVEVHHGVG